MKLTIHLVGLCDNAEIVTAPITKLDGSDLIGEILKREGRKLAEFLYKYLPIGTLDAMQIRLEELYSESAYRWPVSE